MQAKSIHRSPRSGLVWLLGLTMLILCSATQLQAQGAPGFDFSLRMGNEADGADLSIAIQLVLLMTLLSLAPSIVLLMTSFLRIIIVLGFLRNAMGLQTIPPNQVVVGMALFLTFFLMMPTGLRIQQDAWEPYRNGDITSIEAFDRASKPIAQFMLRQTRPADIEFFLEVSGIGMTALEDLPMSVLIPAFVLSELRTAFQMGFLIFLPFLVIDFLVATVLMGMGMMMMPPVVVSTPFKILLFVVVDGWYLITRSIVLSF